MPILWNDSTEELFVDPNRINDNGHFNSQNMPNMSVYGHIHSNQKSHFRLQNTPSMIQKVSISTLYNYCHFNSQNMPSVAVKLSFYQL